MLEECLANPVTLLNSLPDEPRHALTIPFHGVLHVLNQLIKQLLTWYLTHDKVFDVVQSLTCFNWQGAQLGSKATCYLSYPNSAGQADNVIFKLYGLEPERIYKKITHVQSQTGVCASLKRRSEDPKFIARRTQRKG